MRRVAITGIGVVSPTGCSKDVFFSTLLDGRSGIRHIQAPFADHLAVKVAGQVEFDALQHFSKIRLGSLDRFSQFALVAAREAIQDSGITLTDAGKLVTGVYIGTGFGGANALEDAYAETFKGDDEPRIKPFTIILAMNNAAAAQIGLEYGLQGPNETFSTACASSAIAIGEAFRAIRHGYADTMLAGGSEALLTRGAIKSWEALRVLAVADADDPSVSCRPFSKDRSGLVLGEGAAILVLEEMEQALARGAVIHAELAGYGIANDASHLTKPAVHGQARAMTAALADAGVSAQDIDYINAHGTATPVGDVVETRAIREVFGAQAEHVAISSTKSMHGHLMGATGAVEFAAAVLAIRHQAIPPTAHLRIADPECNLDYVANTGRHAVRVQTVMSNAFAFGGSNAVLIARAL